MLWTTSHDSYKTLALLNYLPNPAIIQQSLEPFLFDSMAWRVPAVELGLFKACTDNKCCCCGYSVSDCF